MPILSSELVFYRSATVNDTATNGGHMSGTSAITTGVKNNIFPDVSQADRTAGITTYRKVFLKVDNAANLVLQNSRVFLDTTTAGGDYVVGFPTTAASTQADITGTERVYGGATLAADAPAGATTITVNVEDGTVIQFFDTDVIRLTNAADVFSAGTIELATISGVPVVTGNSVAITLAAPLANAFLASNTRVAPQMISGNITTSFTTPVVTSTAGTYDAVANPILLENLSTIDESWTLTFTSATAFDVVGARVGAIGTGTTAAGVAINNPDWALPYFTLSAAGFAGTYAIGDTITFSTTSATYPVWLKRVVPAGTASLSGNNFTIAVEGESA